jgi:hypothetical protein
MSSTTMDADVRDYVSALERCLDDLPDADRKDLLEDLEQHIREVAAEGDGTLAERLGAPEAYAEELRASAGLPPRVAPTQVGVADRVRASMSRLADLPGVRAVRGFLPDLRPGWWVLRGYLAAVAIDAVFFRSNPVSVLPWPSLGGDAVLGTLFVAACVIASVALGKAAARERRFGYLGAMATIGVVVLSLFAVAPLRTESARMIRFEAIRDVGPRVRVEVGPPGFLQHGDGAPIANVCAYDEKGRRLDDAQVVDQDGRPVVGGAPRGKLGVVRGDGSAFEAFPTEPVPVDPMTGEAVPFKCPKKLKDLQSRGAGGAPGLMRKKMLEQERLHEKLRPFVD